MNQVGMLDRTTNIELLQPFESLPYVVVSLRRDLRQI